MAQIDARVKLRHLRAFLETARRGGVAAAAEALSVSQPAVSKSLRELEELLGARLLERGRAGVALTPAGEVFQHYAAASLAALNQGFHGVAQGRVADAPALRIGALPTVAARLAPQAVRVYSETGGGALVSLETGPNTYLLERLRAGELDLVVGRLAPPSRMRELSFTHLYSEPVVLAARADHPLSRAPAPLALERIAAFQTILPPRGAVIRDVVEQLLIAHGVGPLANQIETVSPSFGRAYLRMTDAVWFISEGVVADDVAAGSLTLLAAPLGDASGPVGLTLRAGVDPSPALRRFIAAIHAALRAQKL